MQITTLNTKFKVGAVTNFENDCQTVTLYAVTDGSEENKSFSKYTPYGKIELTVTNPNAQSFFTPGQEVYIDFNQQPVNKTSMTVEELQARLGDNYAEA